MKRYLLFLLLACLPSLSSASCVLSGETCEAMENGACVSEHLSYKCTQTTQTCAQYSTVTAGTCSSVNTAQTQDQTAATPNPQNFNDAMKDLALLNAIKRDITAISPIRIFGGKYMNCVNPLASGIGLTANCCNSNLKPGAHGIFAGCSNEAVKLAGYVRAGTAYQFYPTSCNGGLSLLGSCVICSGNQQDYCVFDNELAMIIQEKGRAQLAALAAAGYAGATSGSAQTFSYYTGNSTSTTGNWYAFPSVNGNQIWAWQWPGACQSSADIANLTCPSSPRVYFAVCEKSGCATPTNTEQPMSSTSPTGDTMVPVNVTTGSSSSQALSKFAVVTGTCNSSNSCTYTESAYPGAGDAVLRATLNWPLYVYSVGSNNGYLTQGTTANAIFWGQSLPLSSQTGTLPSTVNVEYSQGDVEDGSYTASNAQYTVALPTNITMTQNYQITGNSLGKITVFGSCSAQTNICSYTFEVPATVHEKPWYTQTHSGPCNHMPVQSTINCSGFTLQEFEELNLGKMHLGQVLLNMAPKEPSESSEQSTATGEANAQASNPDAP